MKVFFMDNKTIKSLLKRNWRIEDNITIDESGGSRITWKIGNNYWLTKTSIDKIHSFKKENTLLSECSEKCKNLKLNFTFPQPMPTTENKKIVKDEKSIYRLTGNISGVKLLPSDQRIYPILYNTVKSMHSLFSSVSVKLCPIQFGVIEFITELINRDQLANEEPLIKNMYDIILPIIQSYTNLPKQVTHGDFNFTNIIISKNESTTVKGILDLEHSRPDPAIMDFAQLFVMLICHSNIKDPRKLIKHLLDRLSFEFNEIYAFMIAYWIEIYFRYKYDSLSKKKILFRIKQIKEFNF